MAEPTLQMIFGTGTTQTATTLTIPKAALEEVGLTAEENNRPEQLLAAILLKLKASLTEKNQETNPEQNITVVEDSFYEQLVDRNDKKYRQKTLTIHLQREEPLAPIDPDDY